jgi:hypothetical protein
MLDLARVAWPTMRTVSFSRTSAILSPVGRFLWATDGGDNPVVQGSPPA